MKLDGEIQEYLSRQRTDKEELDVGWEVFTSLSQLDQVKLWLSLSRSTPEFCQTEFFIKFCKQDWVKNLSL